MSAIRAATFRRYITQDEPEEPPLETLERARALFTTYTDIEPVSMRTRLFNYRAFRIAAAYAYLVVVGTTLAGLVVFVLKMIL